MLAILISAGAPFVAPAARAAQLDAALPLSSHAPAIVELDVDPLADIAHASLAAQDDVAALWAERTLAATSPHGDALTIIDLLGAPLQFSDLSDAPRAALLREHGSTAAAVYETNLARILEQTVELVLTNAPLAELAIVGLPIEFSTPPSADEIASAEHYRHVLAMLDGSSAWSLESEGAARPGDLSESLAWEGGVAGAGGFETSTQALAVLLGAWGTGADHSDYNNDNIVNASDLAFLLGHWNFGSPGGGSGGAAPVIQPGNGFSGPTPQPPIVGSGPGATAKVIGRWDVVPHQTFSDTLIIGVVAFHINGINRVEFSAEGGPWTSVTGMSLNPLTQVWEYCATLDASDFPDGEIEVRARIYPNVGKPRVLESLYLNINANGSLPSPVRYVSPSGNDNSGTGTSSNPFKTITRAVESIDEAHGSADGGIVYLKAGNYQWGPPASPPSETHTRWLTVQPAPGVSQAQVKITSYQGGGLKLEHVRLRNLTVYRTSIGTGGTGIGLIPRLWLDGCVLTGNGPTHELTFAGMTSWAGGIYATGCDFSNVLKPAGGFAMIRNCTFHDIGADAIKDSRLVINVTISDIGGIVGLDEHADVLQYTGSFENVIVYGLRATNDILAQGFFSRRNAPQDGSFDNAAFVNYLVETEWTGQWQQSGDHILFWHFSYLGGPFWMRDDSNAAGPGGNGLITTMTNLSIRNCVFNEFLYTVTGGPPESNIGAINNHFVLGPTYGSQATLGNPQFVNQGVGNYEPGPNSPLRDRVHTLIVPSDMTNSAVEVPGSIGPLQP